MERIIRSGFTSLLLARKALGFSKVTFGRYYQFGISLQTFTISRLQFKLKSTRHNLHVRVNFFFCCYHSIIMLLIWESLKTQHKIVYNRPTWHSFVGTWYLRRLMYFPISYGAMPHWHVMYNVQIVAFVVAV